MLYYWAMSTTTATYTLRHRGADLTVETSVGEGKAKNLARLVVDGTEVDAGTAEEIGSVELGQDTEHHTRVAWWWTGRVGTVALIETGAGEERHRRLPYAPPPGTRAARVHAWGERHPTLYAARHVVINVLGTAAAVFGIGALLSALVPRISLGWLPDLPEINAPDWLKYLDPARYLAPLLDWIPPLIDRLFGWIPDWELGWLKYLIGFVIAVSIAVREVRRRQRVDAENAARTRDEDSP